MQYSFPSSDYSLIINCRNDYNCEQPKMDNIGKKSNWMNQSRISNLHIRAINSKIIDKNEKQMMMSLNEYIQFTMSIYCQHHRFQRVKEGRTGGKQQKKGD